MATKKTTGKKLADMMYGNPEGAAFGFFPQLGRRGQAKPAPKQAEKPFIDQRAMELPQFGEMDLDVPTAANRAMGQRMVERDVDLKRQADRDMSPLEKLAGGIQTGRLLGSALTQSVKSIPTAITKGGKAAEDYIAENIYQPTQPKAYEYAGNIADFLTSLESDYKIPPIIPEAMVFQNLMGPATRQAGRAAQQGALAAGRAGERLAERAVPQIMERGGAGADILRDMVQGSRSYAYRPHTPLKPDPDVGTRYKKQFMGGLAPRKDLDIEDLEKSSVKIFPHDATSRNYSVTEVSDIPLTNPVLTEGGDDYMRDLQHMKQRIATASNPGIAKRIQKRVDQAAIENQLLGGTGKVYGFPVRMGDLSERAATFPTDIAMDLLMQGGLNKKEMAALTKDLRTMAFEGKGRGYFKDVAPIGSPEFMVQLREGVKADKDKGISAVTDMNLRKGLMDRLALVENQKRLGFNIQDLTNSVLADELKGVPKGYVGNVAAELDPFTATRPSSSSTYGLDIGGLYEGSMPNMPVEFLTPNTFEGLYREMKTLYPKAKPEALRNMTIGAMEKRNEGISEMIGPRSVDAVKTFQEGLKQGEFDPNNITEVYDYMRRKKLGLELAAGGAVHFSDNPDVMQLEIEKGGEVKAPAAQIDGNQFILAAQKYGLDDSMSTLNKMVSLVNRGATVEEAARTLSGGVRKAAGGEITADDLILEERKL